MKFLKKEIPFSYKLLIFSIILFGLSLALIYFLAPKIILMLGKPEMTTATEVSVSSGRTKSYSYDYWVNGKKYSERQETFLNDYHLGQIFYVAYDASNPQISYQLGEETSVIFDVSLAFLLSIFSGLGITVSIHRKKIENRRRGTISLEEYFKNK